MLRQVQDEAGTRDLDAERGIRLGAMLEINREAEKPAIELARLRLVEDPQDRDRLLEADPVTRRAGPNTAQRLVTL